MTSKGPQTRIAVLVHLGLIDQLDSSRARGRRRELLERDSGHGLVDEVHCDTCHSASCSGRRRAREQSLASDVDGHARGVAGDPASPEPLGAVGSRARAAGRIEDEVAGICGHRDAACNDLRIRLHDVDLGSRGAIRGVSPDVRQRHEREVVEIAHVPRVLAPRLRCAASRASRSMPSLCLPVAVCGRGSTSCPRTRIGTACPSRP